MATRGLSLLHEEEEEELSHRLSLLTQRTMKDNLVVAVIALLVLAKTSSFHQYCNSIKMLTYM